MNTDDDTRSDAPKTRRGQAKVERREALVEATITSIAEYGLSGTTIARVTDIAGTSAGLANFYFENKERLFEAVLQHLADEELRLTRDRVADVTQTPAEILVALIDARFDPRVCNPRRLAVWFAFWGDAGARVIYRRIVEVIDEARLAETVAAIEHLGLGAEGPLRDPRQTALGLVAFYDGLWLNLLLYPDDFKRSACRQTAVEYLCALFPNDFHGLQTVAARASGKSSAKGT